MSATEIVSGTRRLYESVALGFCTTVVTLTNRHEFSVCNYVTTAKTLRKRPRLSLRNISLQKASRFNIIDVLHCQYKHSTGMELIHHSFTHSLTHSLIHSFTHSLIHSFTHSLIHSPIHSLTHSPTYSLTHSLTHPLTNTHTFIQSPIHPHMHSLTLLINHPLTNYYFPTGN